VIKVKKTVLTQHKIENIYNLVKDINSYKFFLPGCIDSYIISSQLNSTGYEQVVARIDVEKMLVNTNFVSENTYITNQRIDINLIEGPFSHLKGYWEFSTVNNVTRIEFYLEYQFNNFILSKLYSAIFDTVTQQILDAFLLRADSLYGAN
jgi:ribosome-associated toxin RatA of RatAB toxin-antitoxin module